jgi:hypothetical protein
VIHRARICGGSFLGAGLCLAAALLLPARLRAESTAGSDPSGSEAEINRNESNPLGTDWFVKVQSNTYLLDVDEFHTRRVEEVIQIQPRITVQLHDGLLFVSRPTLTALESTPYKDADGSLSRALGFGDLELPMALTPELGPNWLVGAGPTFVLPTATTHETGKGKWQAGPAAVLGWQDPDWLAAVFAQQWWSFAGSEQRRAVSTLKVQYFLSRFLRDGWSVGMSPTILVDWKADGGQQLTFPVGLGVGKVLKFGDGTALKLGVQLQYMPIHPDEFGQEMNLQLSIAPVFAPPFRGPVFPLRRKPASRDPAAGVAPAAAD